MAPPDAEPARPSVPSDSNDLAADPHRLRGDHAVVTAILNAYALPSLVEPSEMASDTVVVIDVLRASTTMIYALEAGATAVIPCLEVGDALREAKRRQRDHILLGGERDGLPIEGFDLGNTPTDYTAERVEGRDVIFTTTNGTRALHHCRQADQVIVAAFANASAVVERLLGHQRIHILCAGTRGQYSRDDVLCAGLLVERLQRLSGGRYTLNVQAITARENWTSAFALPYAIGAEPLPTETLAQQLRESLGGRNLGEIGLDADVVTAARIDVSRIVPTLDQETFRVVP